MSMEYRMSMEVLGGDGSVIESGGIGTVMADGDAAAVKMFDEIIADVDGDLKRMYGQTNLKEVDRLLAAVGTGRRGRRFRAFLTDGGRVVAERSGGVA